MTKYTALEQSNEDFSMLARKSHSKERTTRTFAIVERTQALISDNPRAIVAKISIDYCKRVNNALNYRGGTILTQIVHKQIKIRTNAL